MKSREPGGTHLQGASRPQSLALHGLPVVKGLLMLHGGAAEEGSWLRVWLLAGACPSARLGKGCPQVPLMGRMARALRLQSFLFA